MEEQTKEEKFRLESFLQHLKEYAEERVNLVVLNFIDKVSRSISGIALVLTISILVIFALVFVSAALAWWLGQLLGALALGFLIVGAIYILIALVIYTKREKWIVVPVINAFLKNISSDEEIR